MDHAKLMSHVDTDLVTRDQLRLVAVPESTPTFRPIPHIDLVEQIDLILAKNQIYIREEQFALRRDGSVLFGVLQLAYGNSSEGTAALGLRTSNNKTMAIQICAGFSVFVCDNLVFRGDMIALRRKHTSGLDLQDELVGAVLRFKEHFGILTGEIEALKNRHLTDGEAKAFLHDAFVRGVMPLRLLPKVSAAYFAFADSLPHTAWALHNAFTVVSKAMPMPTRMQAIQELGTLFGMSSGSSPKLLAA